MDMLKNMNPQSILDIGCGEGFLTQIVHGILPEVPIVGIDLSEDAIKAARQRCPDLKFQVGDIGKVPFETDSFDLVICSEVLEHVTEPDKALSEICRISKQHIFLSVPHEPWFWMLNLCALNHLSTLGNAPGHINHWGMKGFRNLASTQIEVKEIRSSLPWILVHGTNLNKKD